MYSPFLFTPPRHYRRSIKDSWGRLLTPIVLWICVSVSLKYGYYGDRRMVLGPGSSRLLKASSVFVELVEVRDDDRKGALLYGFSEKPELSCETNWSLANYLIVAAYGRKGFSLWLNKGSRISMRWEVQTSTLNQVEVVMVKGEQKTETLLPTLATSLGSLNHSGPLKGKEFEYTIEEDDKYYLGLINSNPRRIATTFTVNVTFKTYDLSQATDICSTTEGSCRIKLPFPNVQYVVLTTPSNGDIGGWYIELSFLARIVTYIALLAFIIIMIFLVLKYLGACEGENTFVDTSVNEVNETEPILQQKPIPVMYGTNREDDDDDDGSSSSSSEDLYDAKLCVICYDDQRNCFFVPCGHCATCYDCAQRIMEGESKICPICRRLIHKVRRLFSP